MSEGRRTTGSASFATRIGRVLTSPLRGRPDFLIIGAQRCGTTSLYEYLVQHPMVQGGLYKETRYFTTRWWLGPLFYRACFPTFWEMRTADRRGRAITGEATPEYMWNRAAALRIKQKLPAVKLIAILRDPIERAQSNYRLARNGEWETLSFEEAIEAEPHRTRRRPGESDAGYYGREEVRRFSYVSRGEYADQLDRVIDILGRERLFVLRFESLVADPHTHLGRLFEFLGLPPCESIRFDVYHKAPSATQIKPETEHRLREHFAPHNVKLQRMFGPEFTW